MKFAVNAAFCGLASSLGDALESVLAGGLLGDESTFALSTSQRFQTRSAGQRRRLLDEEDDLASIIVSDARRVSIDGEGRIVLPPELIRFAEIDERVTFVGRGARFQIWDPATFSEKAAEARERAKGRTMRLLPSEGRE